MPVGDSVFKLLDCDLFDVDQPENHMARHLESRMAALWAESGLLVPGKRPFTWVIQLQVPGPPYKSFCMYYGCPDRDVACRAAPDSRTPEFRRRNFAEKFRRAPAPH